QENDRKLTEKFDRVAADMRRMRDEVSEQQKETARQMKETDRRLGDLGNRFGELAEHLVAPGIVDKFNALGFRFTRSSLDTEFKDPATGKSLAEVDIFLENGDIVIAVEVKSKPKNQDVNDHIKRMGVLRRIADRKGDNRKYRGAIAGAIVKNATRGYAQKSGLYVLEQSGDTIKLDIPEGFAVREW
ncbi:MAG: hypothetical protein FWG35_01895, partial [Spirochaetaceae bacterium]|nr:hypothetical protein [Spirochaetaceae bacterium]